MILLCVVTGAAVGAHACSIDHCRREKKPTKYRQNFPGAGAASAIAIL